MAHYIVRIDSYTGDGTALECSSEHTEDGDWFVDKQMYVIVSIGDKGALIVDYGYRTLDEAQRAWPEAKPCEA